jgi:hypothetical protein
MSNPYRTMCAELSDRLQRAITSSKADDFYHEDRDSIDRARALLAQPELPELTDEALTTTYAYVEELPLLVPLAQPVAVSERLPGAEDCDEQGRCWWGFEETDDYEPCWTLRKMHGIPFSSTRFIPANALPTPNTP